MQRHYAYNRLQIVEKPKGIGVGAEELPATIMFGNLSKEPEDKEIGGGAFALSDTWLKVQGEGKGWGNTTVKVKAGLFETAAFFWDFDSRAH